MSILIILSIKDLGNGRTDEVAGPVVHLPWMGHPCTTSTTTTTTTATTATTTTATTTTTTTTTTDY